MKAGWGIQQMGPLPSAPEAVTKLSLERRSWGKTCASRFAAIGESPAIHRGESAGGKSLGAPFKRSLSGSSHTLLCPESPTH